MIIPERLKAAMEAKGFNQSELARRVEISSSMINKLLKGQSRNSAHIYDIARVLSVSPEYLSGDAQEGGETDDPSRDAVTALPAVPPEPDPDLVEIDSIDLAYGMGGSFLDTDDIEIEKATFSRKWLRQFTKSPPHLLCSTRGIGDSMMPTIHDQDVVIIDRSQTSLEMGDKIWAVVFAGLGMIKRLRALPDGTMRISSDNQLVRDEIAGDGELFVVGRVVAIVKSV